DEYEGTPTEATHSLEAKLSGIYDRLRDTDRKITEAMKEQRDDLLAASRKLSTYATNFDVRKLAACTNHDTHTFYILCGWMTESDAAAFRKELEHDFSTFCFVEDDHNNIMSKPPTKLKNPKLFKPFEMFIQMYGLPSYDEIDPTIILGLTYSFLFGFMFGDVGQGLCLLIGGFLLYRAKKMNLAAIISCCGFFSTIFGFLFGSVFGFENILEPIWLHPKTAMTKLPFIGNLNTVFVVAIAMGMGIVLMTMILNVINSLRCHDPEKAYFDTNGIAGIVFYGALATVIVLYMSGNPLPATAVLAVMFLLPLLVIFCKEPLTALVEKKAKIMPEEKGMFFVQGFFELFEVLLSYFSNTLSFVRVGAFAVSHAAMMEVVLMLAGAEAGSPNWLIVVLGNLFVCGMEGLIVGIQVLRLEYYELFSRFYKGTGRMFRPYGKTEL
ncbi:MAG: V-type ATP synthase subunit I, partial [Anaerovoracaceae bacterium]